MRVVIEEQEELLATIADLVMQMPDQSSDDDSAIANRIARDILALPQISAALALINGGNDFPLSPQV